MAWSTETSLNINQVSATFPEVETDYIDPVLNRSLVEHLKSFWLLREMHGYSEGYEAAKVKQYLEKEKFSEKDWMAIAKVCSFSRSWAIRQLEEYEH